MGAGGPGPRAPPGSATVSIYKYGESNVHIWRSPLQNSFFRNSFISKIRKIYQFRTSWFFADCLQTDAFWNGKKCNWFDLLRVVDLRSRLQLVSFHQTRPRLGTLIWTGRLDHTNKDSLNLLENIFFLKIIFPWNCNDTWLYFFYT